MGLFSALFGGGGSSSTNTTQNTTMDQRQTVQHGNNVNSGGGNVTVNETPQGAFGVVRAAITDNTAVSQHALDLSGQAITSQSAALNEALTSANSSTQLALQTLQAVKQPSSAQASKFMTLAIPAIAAVLIFKGK